MTQRSLADWLSYLEQLHPTAIDMGLDRVRQVFERLGLHRPARQVVTVTGTNGKGSTCAFLASLLAAHGQRVGVYSSPHLRRYNERVVIEGQQASDEDLCTAFAAVEAARGDISLTYFEMGTLAAFWLFERSELDFAVLEVGLGGRLDAVNVIDADLAIITSIGLDHAEWLGTTRESVATEKAGVLRAGKPGLCGDTEAPQLLEQLVHAKGVTPWLSRGRDFGAEIGADGWRWLGRDKRGQSVSLDALPVLDLPVENAAVALQALYLLVDEPRRDALISALTSARLAGRFDRRTVDFDGRNIELVLDVGHNPHAAQYLARRLATAPIAGQRIAVFGLLTDKDLSGVLEALQPYISQWVVCTLDSPRARSAFELAQALRARDAKVLACQTVADALDASCRMAGPHDQVLVFGSFYCVAEGLDWLERKAEEAVDGVAR